MQGWAFVKTQLRFFVVGLTDVNWKIIKSFTFCEPVNKPRVHWKRRFRNPLLWHPWKYAEWKLEEKVKHNQYAEYYSVRTNLSKSPIVHNWMTDALLHQSTHMSVPETAGDRGFCWTRNETAVRWELKSVLLRKNAMSMPFEIDSVNLSLNL